MFICAACGNIDTHDCHKARFVMCLSGPGASAWASVTSVVISCCFASGSSAGWCCLSQFFATWMGCQSAEPDTSITQPANDLRTMNMSEPG